MNYQDIDNQGNIIKISADNVIKNLQLVTVRENLSPELNQLYFDYLYPNGNRKDVLEFEERFIFK